MVAKKKTKPFVPPADQPSKKLKGLATKANGMWKAGAPRRRLNTDQLLEMARLHHTYEDIARMMNCSVDLLHDRYKEVIEKGRAVGRMALRQAQFKNALQGSHVMQIWLGKQYLGQRDQADTNVTFEPDVRRLLSSWEQKQKKLKQAEVEIKDDNNKR